jgi:MFS family permease
MSRPGGLWRNGDFVRLWSAQTISELGTQVTFLALPLAAILALHASAFEVALLTTAETLPFLLFALPAGVWIDRMRRRPPMIAADVVRGLVLLSIPLAYWIDALTLGQLFAVAFVVGIATVAFDVAYLSYLPALVPPQQLADGNAKLMTTQSGAQLGGPGLGGALVGLFSAPVAILADAISYAFSALLLGTIRRVEEPVVVERRHLRHELAEGLRYVFGQPTLRTLTIWTGAWNFFNSGFFALMLVYMVRGLGLSATTVGWIFALGNLGAITGAILSARVVRRFGVGPTMTICGTISAAGAFVLPSTPRSLAVPLVLVGELLITGFGQLYNVNQLTLRQAITPPRLMARMNSVVRFMYWGTRPVGAALGGALVAWIGLRSTLYVEAACATATTIPMLLSPVHRLRGLDDAAVQAPAATVG